MSWKGGDRPCTGRNLSELSLCVSRPMGAPRRKRKAVFIMYTIRLCVPNILSTMDVSLSNVTYPRVGLNEPLGECVTVCHVYGVFSRRILDPIGGTSLSHVFTWGLTCRQLLCIVFGVAIASPLFCLTFQRKKRLSACTGSEISDSPRRLSGPANCIGQLFYRWKLCWYDRECKAQLSAQGTSRYALHNGN